MPFLKSFSSTTVNKIHETKTYQKSRQNGNAALCWRTFPSTRFRSASVAPAGRSAVTYLFFWCVWVWLVSCLEPGEWMTASSKTDVSQLADLLKCFQVRICVWWFHILLNSNTILFCVFLCFLVFFFSIFAHSTRKLPFCRVQVKAAVSENTKGWRCIAEESCSAVLFED